MGKFWDWLSGESNRRKLFKNDKATDGLTVRGIYDDLVGNSQIDKTLSAQSKENALSRDYNLKLAEVQNNWNIQQWERENNYNSPSSQKARLAAAGLNADMMYGDGISNVSASSPDLTSGSPYDPMDWSALANKKSVADGLNLAKSFEMIDAQIQESKARARKTLADAGLSEISLEYEDAMKRIGLKLSEQEYEKSKVDLENAKQAIELNKATLEGITLDNALKAINNYYADERNNLTNKKLAADLKISEEQAKNAAKYFAAQLLGLQADNAWKDAAWIVQQKEGVATLIKYGSESIGDLLGNLLSWVNPKGKKPKSFKKMKKDGNVLTWE